MSYERLMREHDEIAACCARVVELAQATSPQPEQVITLLQDLDAKICDHLLNEDPLIYNQVITKGSGRQLHQTHDFFESLTMLREDWMGYLSEWDATCITADWDGFCAETIAIMSRVAERVALETTLLYPLALKTGAIALRDSRGSTKLT